jgi:hypothetical protein
MGGNQSKNTPLECMVKHFKKGFNGDYGDNLTPNRLKALCEVNWPTFSEQWSTESGKVTRQNCG